jgi:hypothetical protein
MGGSNDEHKIRLLTGGLFEYLDEGMLDEMIEDIRISLKKEEERALEQANMYRKARKLLCGDKK